MKKIVLSLVILLTTLTSFGQCPTVYTVTGGGAYCGGVASTLSLSGSDAGTTYQLYSAGVTVGSALSGTGTALNWTLPIPAAYGDPGPIPYNVIATHGSCSLAMRDTVWDTLGIPNPISPSSIYICAGAYSFASDSVPYGTWSSLTPSIATIDTSGMSAYDGLFAMVRSVSVGTGTIMYSITTSCGTHSVTSTVTVGTPDSATTISGPREVCPFIPVSYSSTTTGGYWSVGSTYIATISTSTGSLIGVTVGNTTVSYSSMMTCGMTLDTFAISVVSSSSGSSISGPFALLTGDSTTFTSSFSSPTWSVSPPTVASVSGTGIVRGISPGMANVFATISGGCSTRPLSVAPPGSEISDSFYVTPTPTCSGPFFTVVTNSPTASLTLITYYGDGSYATHSIGGSTAYYTDTFSHTFGSSGTYSIKQVLYYSGVPKDSLMYDYHYTVCHDISLSLYYDANRDCTYEAGTDFYNPLPVQVEIDSAGVVIDTVSATSGLYYTAFGTTGTVYQFRVISPYLYTLCPSSGLIYDTITTSGFSSSSFSIPLVNPSESGFDLRVDATARVGRHLNEGDIVISNPDTTATSAFVTLHYDPRYPYVGSSPTPTLITDSTLTWFISSVDVRDSPVHISYYLNITGTWLTIGDTVRTSVSVTPTAGDVDTTNNYITFIDTVNASYDPNYTAVAPFGYILNGTKLHYTIHFENDGNDTAQNIYVMDTLSDDVAPSTLNIEMATATMNVSYLHYGGHTVAKFDFPGIKLLDSAHHGHCTGFVMFTVNALTGLADGTQIQGHAGIYFDDNPVVLTDTAVSTILVPSISVNATPGDSICSGDTVHFTANPHTLSPTHYHWYINSAASGTDTSAFTLAGAAGGDTIKCVMQTIMDDTVATASNSIILIDRGASSAGSIYGPIFICPDTSFTLSETVSGGTWGVRNTHVSITSGGLVHWVSMGTDTITYSVSSICGSYVATYPLVVDSFPVAGPITGATAVCPGDTVTFTDSLGGGLWSVSNSHATHYAGIVSALTPGLDTVIYTVVNYCGTARARHTLRINDTLVPSVTISFSPGDTLCAGDSVSFIPSPVNGGSSPIYHWMKFSTLLGSGATYRYPPANGDVISCVMVSDALCATPTTATSDSVAFVVNAVVTPTDVISTSFGDSITYLGEIVAIHAVTTYCGPGTTYQWYMNGAIIPGATNYTYSANIYTNDTFYCVNTCDAACTTRTGDTSNTLVIYADYLTIGVPELPASFLHLSLFPNPNSGTFELSGQLAGITNETVHLEVLDVTGKTIYTGTTTPKNGQLLERIRLADATGSKVASGQYILRVITGSDVAYMHFVVK